MEGKDLALGGLEAVLEEDGMGSDINEATGTPSARGSARALTSAGANPLTAGIYRKF